jgi:flagellar motor switch protein FliM
MANQILSQEEIDALLSAMDKGEVDLAQEQGQASECKAFDLTAHSVDKGNQFTVINKINDRFVRRLQTWLLSALQRPVIVNIDSKKTEKFSDFINSFSNPASFGVFKIDPFVGSNVFALEPDLFFILLDCWFGGPGQPIGFNKEITELELRIMQKLIKQLLKELQSAWEAAESVTVSLSKIETNPQFLDVIGSNDVILVSTISITINEFSGRLFVGYPYAMLNAAKEKLLPFAKTPETPKHQPNTRIRNLLFDTSVTVIAELGKSLCSLRDLLNLQTNDVLKLDNGPDDLITLRVNNVAKYLGTPGVFKGNRAVQITEIIETN